MSQKRRLTIAEGGLADAMEVQHVSDADIVADQKQQRLGAMGRLRQMARNEPIKATRTENVGNLIFREGYERDPSEYEGKEFAALVEDIKQAGINDQPVHVREVINPLGHPSGVYYEVLAGERRTRAIRAAGLGRVVIAIREADDREAARIHETENSHRVAKSAYARGMQYSRLIKQGVFTSQAELCESLRVNKGDVSVMLSMIEAAPQNLWEKVRDRGSITIREAALLGRAFKLRPFIASVRQQGSLDRVSLMKLARNALVRPVKSKAEDAVLERNIRGRYLMQLPRDVSIEQRAAIRKLLEEFLQAR